MKPNFVMGRSFAPQLRCVLYNSTHLHYSLWTEESDIKWVRTSAMKRQSERGLMAESWHSGTANISPLLAIGSKSITLVVVRTARNGFHASGNHIDGRTDDRSTDLDRRCHPGYRSVSDRYDGAPMA